LTRWRTTLRALAGGLRGLLAEAIVVIALVIFALVVAVAAVGLN
jgi:hypothetical protein